MNFDGCAEPPYVTWDGTVYNLLQVHIHSPSEHLVREEALSTDATYLRSLSWSIYVVPCVHASNRKQTAMYYQFVIVRLPYCGSPYFFFYVLPYWVSLHVLP